MKLAWWNRQGETRQNLLIGLGLALFTVLIYYKAGWFDFTGSDEYFMVVTNPMVNTGFTWQGIWWALTTSWFEYWHPLTWLSHMLDCQLFGLRAGWPHFVNLMFHAANTALVFVLFGRMTGAVWRSAIVAALFAVHPAHVESVAWVAERKDVLSTFFFLLTIWAYVRYAERPRIKEALSMDPASQPRGGTSPLSLRERVGLRGSSQGSPSRSMLESETRPSKLWYAVSLLFFCCALMSKPMVVTLPFVLLLLDYWPLRRFAPWEANLNLNNVAPLLREKAPFFGLALAGCLITYLGAKAGGHVLPANVVPWSLRLANVPISYVRYIGKLLWPTNLIVLYPMPRHWPLWEVVTSVLLLLAITWFVLSRARFAPYLVFGWFMFLGVLVPTIGLVQAGFQSMADRYTYIPFIGLFVAFAWGVADLSSRWGLLFRLRGLLSALVLVVCGVLTWHQINHWQNGLTLWTHCLAATPESSIARFNRAVALQKLDRVKEAMADYQQVLRLNPDHIEATLNLGTAYVFLDQMKEATNCFSKVLQLKPDYAKAHAFMGLTLRELGDYNDAMAHCAEAIRLAPSIEFGAYVDMARALCAVGRNQEAIYYFNKSLGLNSALPQTHYYFGLELLRLGRIDEAAKHLVQALQLAPNWSEAHLQVASVLASKGATSEAIAEYRQAIKLEPDAPAALNNLAWILATSPAANLRDGPEAVRLAEKACRLTSWKQTVFVGTLAAAYAQAGNFDKAIATSQKACELAASRGETNLFERNQELLRQFKNHQPYREGSGLQSPFNRL